MESDELGGWRSSAQAWIASQSEEGDRSRREILDPALANLLGDVSNLTILDVGCGEGRYSRRLASQGATVTGLDPVDTFIEHARERDAVSRYLVASAEAMPLESESFDVVLSYLTIIDIPDYRAAIAEMCRVMKPSGSVLMATISNVASTSFGWIKDENGRKLYRPVDRYMEDFYLDLEWSDIRVRNYHRPLSALLQPFFSAGLVLTDFLEPLPDPSSDWFVEESRAPTFQIMRFRRP